MASLNPQGVTVSVVHDQILVAQRSLGKYNRQSRRATGGYAFNLFTKRLTRRIVIGCFLFEGLILACAKQHDTIYSCCSDGGTSSVADSIRTSG
jgi:hypothetical protein